MSATVSPNGVVSWRRLSTWVLVATVVWTAESAVYAAHVQLLAARRGQAVDFGVTLLQSAVSALLWVPITVLALWLAFRWPVTVSPWYWAVHVVGLGVVVVGRVAAVVILNDIIGWYPDGVPAWSELLLTSVLNNLVTYVLMTGLAHAVFYHQAACANERRFAAARLNALTSQLQPHFLFNALNTIAAMIPSKPEVAERMVEDLSSLLRFSVDRDSEALVPLSDEIAIGQAYLKIEEHRFSNRLRVLINIDPEVRDTVLPPFLLQPLLENAVRHGLAPRTGYSTLVIQARRVCDDVHISITDDGVGLPDPTGAAGVSETDRSGGVGLRSVRERLQEVYGGKARVELSNNWPSGVTAVVVVPTSTDHPLRRRDQAVT